MDQFLAPSPSIDWQNPAVLALARKLADGAPSDTLIAERCFIWTRDQVRHTHDFGLVQVTCAASEVLQERTGFCYAKSHLLAALLRANQIPAALTYQRLALDSSGARFCLHGLVAVFLRQYGWYRIDPRGDKAGVTTAFCPPVERLPFQPRLPGEMDVPGLFPEPLPIVTAALRRYRQAAQLAENLPDYLPISDAGS